MKHPKCCDPDWNLQSSINNSFNFFVIPLIFPRHFNIFRLMAAIGSSQKNLSEHLPRDLVVSPQTPIDTGTVITVTTSIESIKSKLSKPFEESMGFLFDEVKPLKASLEETRQELRKKGEKERNNFFLDGIGLSVAKRCIEDYCLERIRRIMGLPSDSGFGETIFPFLLNYDTGPLVPAHDIKKIAQSSDREHWNSTTHIKPDNEHEINRMWHFVKSKITDQEEINTWKRLLEFDLIRLSRLKLIFGQLSRIL
jgi:hypothetical protein